MKRSKFGGIIKKATAVALSMVMAFVAVTVLPNSFVSDNALVAHAIPDSVTINDCIFYFDFTNRTGKQTLKITDATILNSEGRVEIPSKIKYEGVEYPVTEIDHSFLFGNQDIRTFIVPDSVTYISFYVLMYSKVEKVVLPDNLEHIGGSFCGWDPMLESVEYHGTGVSFDDMDIIFQNCEKIRNEQGAICFGNWLVSYRPNSSITSVKIADLGGGDIKIDRIANNITVANDSITSIDFEGVKYIGDNNFVDYSKLSNLSNYDSLERIGKDALKNAPWIVEHKDSGLVKLGSVLIYYKTDAKVLDLTSGVLKGTLSVARGAFADCKNADTLIVNSNIRMDYDCFYEAYKQPNDDSRNPDKLPLISTHKIKDIYLDGKKLEYSKDNTKMPLWVKQAYMALIGSEWVKINCEAKTKDLCEQIGIPYYGINNDKIGTHTPTEEFYIMLKIHEYLSMYYYDLNFEYRGSIGAFLLGGKVDCQGYADLAHYLCECAGVESKSVYNLSSSYHVWNSVRIGDEWFENDNGWDAQYTHTYGWFGLSSEKLNMMDNVHHGYEYACDSWHISLIDGYEFVGASERVDGMRFLGDLNEDKFRDQKDANKLWEHLRGNISIKDTKAADINFDGVVDITDGVLLQNFVDGHAIYAEDYPDEIIVNDGLFEGFNVVFADTYDMEYIDPATFVYDRVDRYRYIELPEIMFDAPEGKKFGGWDYGQEGKPAKAGKKVQINNPYTVITPVWKDESEPDDVDYLLGDVDGSGTIDISDVSKLINHINGVKALDEDEFLRADVNKSNTVEISDASAIVNHINGVKAIEGMV